MNKKKLKSMELLEKINFSRRSYLSSNLVKKRSVYHLLIVGNKDEVIIKENEEEDTHCFQ